jgi:hypothetical protein
MRVGEEVSTPASTEKKNQEPLPSSMTAIAAGLILTLIGSVMSSNWARDTIVNCVGFGIALIGIGIFVFGIFGTATKTLKARLDQKTPACIKVSNTRALIRRIWAVGVGIVLFITGSIVGSCYAKETMLNYAGFGLQLAGIAFLVLGAFETARISANIYMSSKRASDMLGVKKKSFWEQVRSFWKYLVTSRTLYNIAGVMAALSLLLFSIWQLDIIVTGPVWWEASPEGMGWAWYGPGAYAKAPFQCFLWKTTIGQAYDTLFLLIFISFILQFVSVFFWRRRTD